ncbi:MAG: hypothetical protein R2748_31045 [Bryobacterales bacterium]
MRFLLLVCFALPLSAQYVPPGPQTEGCPLRAVDGIIKTITPQGQLTIESKGQLRVAQITSETHMRIPGYDQKQIQQGLTVKLPPGTRGKFRICERNGEIYDMKVVEDKKKKKKD